MTRHRLPRPGIHAAQAVLAIGLLALVWHLADGAQAAQMLARADPLWLMAAVVALSVQTVMSALRWRLTAAQLGIALGRAEALHEYYLSQIVNQTVPGGVIGDAGRALRSRHTAGLMAAGQAVIFERLAGQIALFAVMTLAFATTVLAPGGLEWPPWAGRFVGGLIGAGLALPGLLIIAARLLRTRVEYRLTRQGAALWQALAAPSVRVRQVTLSLGAVLCNIAGFGFCAWAVGVDLPVAGILALVPVILLAMVIPLTIGGWGLREGAAAALLPIAGASASDGLAASVAFGLVFLATALPGIVLIGFGTGGRPAKF